MRTILFTMAFTLVSLIALSQTGQAIMTDMQLDNWSFERDLTFWQIGSGKAFNNQPVIGQTVTTDRVLSNMYLANGGIGGDYWKGMIYPIGIKGKKWIGTYEGQYDAPTGSLYSEPFILTKKFISCLVGGGCNPQKIRVELQMKKSDYDGLPGTAIEKNILMKGDNLVQFGASKLPVPAVDGDYITVKVAYSAKNTEELQRFQWELPDVALGKIFRIKILDNASDGWGHLNVDDFRFTDQPVEVLVIGNMKYDIDKPVFGFADTHTHPAAQSGFGGRTIVGSAEGDMSVEFSDRKCREMHYLPGTGSNNLIIGQSDPHNASGYPDFFGFPNFRSIYHQQMHVEWLRRAHEGGLNLLVAIGVTNMFWPTHTPQGWTSYARIDDESACLQQVEEMKDIARKNSDWMGIADSPRTARELILQGKLAVVLGVEMDNFGNFIDSDYIWPENYPIPPSKHLIKLPEDIPSATNMMQNKLTEYYNLGIRMVTPLHYINGVFGGTAQFRFEFALINNAFTRKTYELTDGSSNGIAYNLIEDSYKPINWVKYVMSNLNIPPLFILSNPFRTSCVNCIFETVPSTMCNTGLTQKGQMMFRELMRKGFIIDVDHASVPSAENIFTIATSYSYPVISSHTDPRDLSFKANRPIRFVGPDESKVENFGTAVLENLTHEGMISPVNINRLSSLGGTVGVLVFPYRKKAFENAENRVPNDCDGSSKTWVQMYLYSVNQTGGHGVALSTDRGGFNKFVGPRFGPWAAYKLKDEPTLQLNTTRRINQKNAQSQAVTYSSSFNVFHPFIFQDGGINSFEDDAWMAVAYYNIIRVDPRSSGYNSLPADKKVPSSNDLTHINRILNMVSGFYMTYEQASAFVALGGSTTQECLAGYCVKNGIRQENLRDAKWHNDEWLRENYEYLHNAWTLWQKITTSTQNEPLRRCKTGTREWDFNLEGLAHYGLLPDFLQDCKNVGLTPIQLQSLFNSAEDFIKMWEKAEIAKLNVR